MTAQIHKPHARFTLAALAVIALAAASACGSVPGLSNGPSGPGPEKTEARLLRIAATTNTPLYYLGAAYNGWPLDDAIIFSGDTGVEGDESLDPGQTLTVGYGDTGGGVEVDIQAADPGYLEGAEGCSRLRPVRGVPTVEFQKAGHVMLLTGDLAISVQSMPDVKVAEDAATALRRVGEDGPTDSPLPPPPAAKIPLIDRGCGSNPGEHGPIG